MSGSSVLFDAPGPRARVRNHLATAVTVLVVGRCSSSSASNSGQRPTEWAKWEPFVTPNVWENYIIPGIEGTLKAAALSIVLARILGVALGVGRLSTHAWISRPCAVFVEFFRAVPVLIMMIFAYFLYSRYNLIDSEYSTLAGVVTGLTLYNGAVIAEIVRAGVNALPRGQSEAASSLGMRWGQTMRSILLPQAITSMLPVLISQLVVVLKDTALGVRHHVPRAGVAGTEHRRGVHQLSAGAHRRRDPDDRRQLRAVVVRGVAGSQTAPITPRSDPAGPGDNRAGGGARRESEGGRTGRLDLIH